MIFAYTERINYKPGTGGRYSVNMDGTFFEDALFYSPEGRERKDSKIQGQIGLITSDVIPSKPTKEDMTLKKTLETLERTPEERPLQLYTRRKEKATTRPSFSSKPS